MLHFLSLEGLEKGGPNGTFSGHTKKCVNLLILYDVISLHSLFVSETYYVNILS